MLSFKDSIIVVDKPKGKSSFWVVSRIRKLSGVKKVGHTGTLDPLATGVLPICIGEATKASDYIMHGDKIYTTKIKLGEGTDTLDAEGVVVKTSSKDLNTVTEQDVLKVLSHFCGDVIQMPPMYSAIKKDGVPLYEHARKGKEIERETRTIRIDKIELLSFALPYVELRVFCSKGTYIRTLVDDIGEMLGTFAYVVELRRERSGPFDISQAVPLEEGTQKDSLQDKLVTLESAILKIMPVITVQKELAFKVANGYQLTYSDLVNISGVSKDWCRSNNIALFSTGVSGEERLLAILMIVPQDFEELINMGQSSKIAKTLRIFNYDEWRR